MKASGVCASSRSLAVAFVKSTHPDHSSARSRRDAALGSLRARRRPAFPSSFPTGAASASELPLLAQPNASNLLVPTEKAARDSDGRFPFGTQRRRCGDMLRLRLRVFMSDRDRKLCAHHPCRHHGMAHASHLS